jgi:hypothetical protein
MRSSLTKVGSLLTVAALVISLTGCSDSGFTDTVKWKGGTFYNGAKRLIQPPSEPMTLKLRPGGRGYAVGIPRGHQKRADNLCIEVTSEDRYDGRITWRMASDYDVEITFPGSTYRVSDGPGKFLPDWTELRIYTCTPGPEFWSMQLRCAYPGLVKRDPPPCRD